MKKAAGIISFVLIFAVLFSYADRILSRKSIEGWWNVTAKLDGFYNSPKNEYDVMVFGSSHAFCNFNPLIIWEKTGVKSYIFATQQQPIWATYHYMVDAFKTQKPDMAIVDVLMMSKNEEYATEEVNHTVCDNMPLSLNKLELIRASAPRDKRFNLLFRFAKYHSRWNALTSYDFEYKKSEMHDFSKGQVVHPPECPQPVGPTITGQEGVAELYEKNEKYLYKIIELCKDKGVELMLVKAPSNATPEQKSYYNAVEKIAGENGVTFVDYNEHYDDIGLELERDFIDESHLNQRGSEKFSLYFIDNVPYFEGKVRSDEDWRDDMNAYKEAVSKAKAEIEAAEKNMKK